LVNFSSKIDVADNWSIFDQKIDVAVNRTNKFKYLA